MHKRSVTQAIVATEAAHAPSSPLLAEASRTADSSLPAAAARTGNAAVLGEALRASRRDTLATFAAYQRALPDLRVPLRPELNPPLWELGHLGWFQEFWLARNPERARGPRADPDTPRQPGVRSNADVLYHSSHVPHDSRWTLPLPDAATTQAELAEQLAGTLMLLAQAGDDDDALYFFRLALLHEDMHHEAALYMAQGLGIPIDDARWQATPLADPPPTLRLEAGDWRLGSEPGAGFAFDNELEAHELALGATAIDTQVVRWAEYLPFVEAGGYRDERWWSDAGRQWLASRHDTSAQTFTPLPIPGASLPHESSLFAGHAAAPPYLRREGGTWQQWRHGRWRPLDLREAACHLTFHEAEAWCRWSGRRLPTEGEWERAAVTQPAAFRWGDVWEWTASGFAPYPGFVAHPYRDYSAPWFDGRPVLRGASFMTQPRMRHPRYRNFFLAERSDVPAGFRSCAK